MRVVRVNGQITKVKQSRPWIILRGQIYIRQIKQIFQLNWNFKKKLGSYCLGKDWRIAAKVNIYLHIREAWKVKFLCHSLKIDGIVPRSENISVFIFQINTALPGNGYIFLCVNENTTLLEGIKQLAKYE